MNYTPKKKWGSLCQRNRSQAKNHLFNHTEKAFVSPIRVREWEMAKMNGQRNYPTYRRPGLATRYEGGQQTQLLLMISLY